MKMFALGYGVLTAVVLTAVAVKGFAATPQQPDSPQRPAASPQMRSDARLNDVCFIDALHGWAVGALGTIWHTADGGGRWRLQPSGVACNLTSVCFLDENTGWAMAHYNDCEDCDPDDEDCEPCDMSKDTTSILMTADGGETWYRDETFDPSGGSMMGARGFFAMDCGTKNTCYVAGYYLTIMRWTRDTPVEDDGSWKTRECDMTSIPDAGAPDDDDDDDDVVSDDDDDITGDDDDNNDTTGNGEADNDDAYDSKGRILQDMGEEDDGGCGCRIR